MEEEEREITTKDWGEPKSDPLAKIMKVRALLQELGISPENAATKIQILNEAEDEEVAMSSVTEKPEDPYTQYAKFEERAMQAPRQEHNPSAEELLDRAVAKIAEIDKELQHLQTLREDMEQQAIKARETLLKKCEQATSAFRHPAVAVDSWALEGSA